MEKKRGSAGGIYAAARRLKEASFNERKQNEEEEEEAQKPGNEEVAKNLAAHCRGQSLWAFRPNFKWNGGWSWALLLPAICIL